MLSFSDSKKPPSGRQLFQELMPTDNVPKTANLIKGTVASDDDDDEDDEDDMKKFKKWYKKKAKKEAKKEAEMSVFNNILSGIDLQENIKSDEALFARLNELELIEAKKEAEAKKLTPRQRLIQMLGEGREGRKGRKGRGGKGTKRKRKKKKKTRRKSKRKKKTRKRKKTKRRRKKKKKTRRRR